MLRLPGPYSPFDPLGSPAHLQQAGRAAGHHIAARCGAAQPAGAASRLHFDTGSPQAVQPCSFHLRPIATPQPEGQPAPLHDGRAFGQLQPVLPCPQSTSVLHAPPSLRCEQGTPAPPSRAARALQERSLCAAERYLPAQYLAIKATVLKLQETRGRVPRGEMLKLPFQASRPCTQYIACPNCIFLADAGIEDG